MSALKRTAAWALLLAFVPASLPFALAADDAALVSVLERLSLNDSKEVSQARAELRRAPRWIERVIDAGRSPAARTRLLTPNALIVCRERQECATAFGELLQDAEASVRRRAAALAVAFESSPELPRVRRALASSARRESDSALRTLMITSLARIADAENLDLLIAESAGGPAERTIASIHGIGNILTLTPAGANQQSRLRAHHRLQEIAASGSQQEKTAARPYLDAFRETSP